MKRAYSPKEIAAKKWVTLPWDEKWSKPFGFPAENASWFISGASASGKSSFVMQLGKELCNYGTVLYMSYEEKINQSFQRRMGYLKMNEVQGKFRVVTEGSLEEVIARLKKTEKPEVYHHRFLSGGRMGLSAGCGTDGNLSEEMFHLDQPGKEKPADGWRCSKIEIYL
jgi:hypothetical protein